MFGKAKTDEDAHDLAIGGIIGDEDAAEAASQIGELRDRVEQVESQLSSQFTSLAAYAQIAQEQVETARAEAKHAAERTERRLIELVERERSDRIAAIVDAPAGSCDDNPDWNAPGRDDRLDALERSVAQIQHGLNECLARQKALADAITALFEPQVAAQQRRNLDVGPQVGAGYAHLPPPGTEADPATVRPTPADVDAGESETAAQSAMSSVSGPISELSIL